MAREKFHANLADALVTHSYAHRGTMASELGVDASSIRVIPLGVPVYPQFTRGRKTEAIKQSCSWDVLSEERERWTF